MQKQFTYWTPKDGTPNDRTPKDGTPNNRTPNDRTPNWTQGRIGTQHRMTERRMTKRRKVLNVERPNTEFEHRKTERRKIPLLHTLWHHWGISQDGGSILTSQLGDDDDWTSNLNFKLWQIFKVNKNIGTNIGSSVSDDSPTELQTTELRTTTQLGEDDDWTLNLNFKLWKKFFSSEQDVP